MQIHPLKIDIDLSRFVLVGREFFWPVEKFFHRSRIFFTCRELFTGRESLWPVENFFYRSRNFFVGREFFYRSRNFLGRSRNFFGGREFFLSVENIFTDREFFFGRSRIFWAVENSFLSREFFCKSRINFVLSVGKFFFVEKIHWSAASTSQIKFCQVVKQGKWRTFWLQLS